MSTFLGRGTYGEVSVINGNAVKKFSQLSHLIQEYMALRYLEDCNYVVHSKGVDFANLQLHMELYDCSLKTWLDKQRNNGGVKHSEIMVLLKDILMGLVEFHDRNLAHGDLKPGNILVSTKPLRAVLGDCGFVSVAKYAKVERTAAIYRDPIIDHDYKHDMFSFGICFLEMVADIKINRQASYEELKHIIREKVSNPEYRKIIYNLVNSNKDRRPKARDLLYRMFKISPPRWVKSPFVASCLSDFKSKRDYSMMASSAELQYVRKIMKVLSDEFEINRGKKGYAALAAYLNAENVPKSMYKLYTAVTLMILSSIFGKSGFRQQQVIEFCDSKYSLNTIYDVLKQLLSNDDFIKNLLSPSFEYKSSTRRW